MYQVDLIGRAVRQLVKELAPRLRSDVLLGVSHSMDGWEIRITKNDFVGRFLVLLFPKEYTMRTHKLGRFPFLKVSNGNKNIEIRSEEDVEKTAFEFLGHILKSIEADGMEDEILSSPLIAIIDALEVPCDLPQIVSDKINGAGDKS